ncbi:MAG: glycogen/starch/alpha-glucan phosphorylase [Candidatus Cloacimonetes bacterium]|nr:glycogen/starch/alpha-glucan phosphorylase [Candidatus Cloacimonadota bacterium]
MGNSYKEESLTKSYNKHLKYTRASNSYTTDPLEKYYTMALAIRDRVINRWMDTQSTYYKENPKRAYYLSLEYLMGRLFENNMMNLGLEKEIQKACEELGLSVEDLIDQEVDAGLGNGGLGRLAACFLDSLATLNYPAIGYGIRYDFGIFRQEIRDGKQCEEPDTWLKNGNPWEIPNPHHVTTINFGGSIVKRHKTNQYDWVDTEQVLALPYDTPIVGYKNNCVNTLRLWSATSTEEFDLEGFNDGDYFKAVQKKNEAERISKVLYPNDNNYEGKELRFKQQYFFVSASVQDIVRRYKKTHDNFDQFGSKIAIQLNDTHPALTVLELMRLLIDDEGLDWDKAWEITQQVCAYTNHTLLPEALEKWSIDFFERILPRHLIILFEINRIFLRDVSIKFHGDQQKIIDMSLIQETPDKAVRMAYLSIVGSHSTNGVAALHSELLKKDLLKDFAELYPQRFNNKTNGVTPRRWVHMCNPDLSRFISSKIGEDWVKDLDKLQELEKLTKDKKALKELAAIKQINKNKLVKIIKKDNDLDIDPNSLFDVQIKRIHEYKRQFLCLLHSVILYNRLKKDPSFDMEPMTVIFGGKAAPGYFMAKLWIKLINSVADFVNNDPDTNHKLKVVFVKNYRVSLAERLFPASDLSEQISTAGMEASGTGNMKFALNGALTIGTMDGANVEMAEEIGEENMFIFGLREEEVEEYRKNDSYSPWDIYNSNTEIREAIDLISSGFFSPEDPNLFEPIIHSLLQKGDYYFVLRDLEDYDRAKMEANSLFKNKGEWHRRALINIANMGKFSSDRTIRNYAEEIWDIKPVEVQIGASN